MTVVDKENSKTTYTVALRAKPSAGPPDVTVTASVSSVPANFPAQLSVQDPNTPGGLTTPGSSVTLTFTASNYSTPQRVTVFGVADEVDDDGFARSSSITHSISASGLTVDDGNDETTDPAYPEQPGAGITVRVTDDDRAGLKFSKTRVATSEDATETYTLELTSKPTDTVSVAVVSNDPNIAQVHETAPAATIATIEFTTENWDEPRPITVTGVNDDVDNPGTRSVRLTHTPRGGGYDAVAPKDVTVSVADGKKVIVR